MGDENDGGSRQYKEATMKKKHVDDTLRRQGGGEKNDAYVSGLIHCQGVDPDGSPEEQRVMGQSEETCHTGGKVNLTSEKATSNLTPNEKVGVPPLLPVADLEGNMLWEISKHEDVREKTDAGLDKEKTCVDMEKESGLETNTIGTWADDNSSPLAMTFNQEKGWVTEPLGPTSGHWKRLARKTKTPSPDKVDCTSKTKRKGPMPLQELDPNNLSSKCKKGKIQVSELVSENIAENGNTVGGEVVATMQHHRASCVF